MYKKIFLLLLLVLLVGAGGVFAQTRKTFHVVSFEPDNFDMSARDDRHKKIDGTVSYKRVGVIAPDPDLIWDNRYMAVEEGAKGALLGKTTFKKVSGSTPVAGMLIREIQ